jgi:hypothetical protein
MTGTGTASETHHCLRCGRLLKSAESKARGYGKGCSAKIRAAAKTADLDAWTPRQLEDARELIEDGGVVPTARPTVFRTVSSDGTGVYLTSARFCGCRAGRKAKACYHGAAVTIVLAASAPVLPVPVAVPAPLPAPADFWAEMDRMTAAFMAVA